jgi:hypothetical protein
LHAELPLFLQTHGDWWAEFAKRHFRSFLKPNLVPDLTDFPFLPLTKLPGYVALTAQNFVYSEQLAHLRDLHVETDANPLDMQDPGAGDWARMGDSRSLDDIFNLLQNPNTDFAKHYSEMQTKKWYRMRKPAVHDARGAARLRWGQARADLRVGMYVATFADPATTRAILKAWGQHYWIGRVTYISDSEPGEDPIGDFQVYSLYLTVSDHLSSSHFFCSVTMIGWSCTCESSLGCR